MCMEGSLFALDRHSANTDHHHTIPENMRTSCSSWWHGCTPSSSLTLHCGSLGSLARLIFFLDTKTSLHDSVQKEHVSEQTFGVFFTRISCPRGHFSGDTDFSLGSFFYLALWPRLSYLLFCEHCSICFLVAPGPNSRSFRVYILLHQNKSKTAFSIYISVFLLYLFCFA